MKCTGAAIFLPERCQDESLELDDLLVESSDRERR